ncbi:hypothetical protein DFJ77DRAFT_469585 [Powellomyces hirtus]|nr:hypothetical protein DFJ77DRAFT_469585 [Powellomyces hirtus]
MAAPASELFAELRQAYEAENYLRTIEVSDKILKRSKNDPDALHAKIVALIRTEQYTTAISTLNAVPESIRDEFVFEHAYCLYRTNKLDHCLVLIRERRDDAVKLMGNDAARSMLQLEAQVLYRKENFAECFEIYQELKQGAGEEELRELHANILAVEAAAATVQTVLPDQMETEQPIDSYEIMYNTACLHLAKGELERAAQLLKAATRSCREALEEDNYTEEEIEHELGIVSLQLAYVYQIQGKVDEAEKLYRAALNIKANDSAITAVASNNLLAIRGNHDLLESAKLFRSTTASGVEYKLNSVQKRILAINGALLALHSKKIGDARQKGKQLAEKFPEDATILLILASTTLLSEESPTAALKELQLYIQKLPHSLEIHLAAAQLQIAQQNYEGAFTTLRSYLDSASADAKYEPGLVSLLVWLHGQMDEVDVAVSLLQDATKHWQNNAKSKHDASSLKHLASFKLRSHQAREAAQDYEQLVKANPSDVEAVAGLIIAYSEYDPTLAEQYQAYLPAEVLTTPSGYDAELLESTRLEAIRKSSREETEKSKTRKRKRKQIPPKNYNPDVAPDPERWLPKRDRSTFAKKGKGKKDIGRGPQGMALAGGGIGGTGSANISGSVRSSVTVKEAPSPPADVQPAATGSSGSSSSLSNKKKKKKGKK